VDVNRRGFLTSILALGVAPAIVRADSLMKIVPVNTGITIYPSLRPDVSFDDVIAKAMRETKERIVANVLNPFFVGDPVMVEKDWDKVREQGHMWRKAHVGEIFKPLDGVVVGIQFDGKPIVETDLNKTHEVGVALFLQDKNYLKPYGPLR
jgi:hypothetical protein